MDPLSIFALTVATMVAAENAALAHRYAVAAQYGHPVAARPAWEAAPHAYPYAYAPVARSAAAVPGWIAGADVAPVPRSSSSPSSDAFIERWQNFMEPSVSRP